MILPTLGKHNHGKNKMKFDAAFFDMDGTLVDSERLYGMALSQSLKVMELYLEEDQSLQLVYGRAWSSIYMDLLKLFPELDADEERLDGMVLKHFHRIQTENPDGFIIEGSRKLLLKLAEKMPVGIVSGSTGRHLAGFVETLGIREQLSAIVGSEDYAQGKPAPHPYLEAAKRLGVEPDRCVVFEDSSAGVRSAKAAGMFCVALKRPGAVEQDVLSADQIVSDLEEWK